MIFSSLQRFVHSLARGHFLAHEANPLVWVRESPPCALQSMLQSFEWRLGAPLHATTHGELTLSFKNELYIGTNLIYINQKALHCLRRVSVGG